MTFPFNPVMTLCVGDRPQASSRHAVFLDLRRGKVQIYLIWLCATVEMLEGGSWGTEGCWKDAHASVRALWGVIVVEQW